MPQLSLITPFPGTRDWLHHKDKLLPGFSFDHFTITNMVWDHPEGALNMAKQYDRAASRIYSRRQIARRLLRIARKHGPYAAWVALLVNTVYRQLMQFRYRPA